MPLSCVLLVQQRLKLVLRFAGCRLYVFCVVASVRPALLGAQLSNHAADSFLSTSHHPSGGGPMECGRIWEPHRRSSIYLGSLAPLNTVAVSIQQSFS